MLLHSVDWETQPVMLAYCLGDTHTELMARYVGRHLAYIAADEHHGITAIAQWWAMTSFCLGCAAIDNGYEIICDDDPVLAFLRGAFRYDALLYYFHF